ncbi:MAG: thrombospondin type 3 repeat-containing protein [Cyclobacteriaceae bacterium]
MVTKNSLLLFLTILIVVFVVPVSCGGDEEPIAMNKSDFDNDGVADGEDNCPDTSNPDQQDSDGDGVGDACEDLDSDNDGVADGEDNCPNTSNPDQQDSNGDGVGDACEDLDSDDDGVADGEDNCPNTSNPDQQDSDGDGVGDACEDPDGPQGPTSLASEFSTTIGGSAYSFEINGDDLFVGSTFEGLISYDISDISNPSKQDEVKLTFANHDPLSLVYANNRIWVGSNSYLYLIDVSTPQSIALKKGFEVDGEVFTLGISGSKLYTSQNNFGFQILDISDELDVKYVSGYNPSGSEGYRFMAFKDNYAFVVQYENELPLDVIDFSTESNPFLAESIKLLPGNNHFKYGGSAISGNYLYVSAFDEGLIIIDISQPNSPSVVSVFDPDEATSNQVAEFDIGSDFAVISDANYGIHVVDLSDLKNPAIFFSQEIEGGISGGILDGSRFIGVNSQNPKKLHFLEIE